MNHSLCLHLVRISELTRTVMRESGTILNSVCDQWNSISNICLIENVAHAFGASFQENKSPFLKKVICGFCFGGSVTEEACKTSPHTREELRNSIRREISKNTREELRRVPTTYFAGILNPFRQEMKNFHICCNTGEYLLDSLKFTITAIVCLAPFIDC
jgi:hypothetical protein